MDIKSVRIEKSENTNVIVGQAHFVKTVEDIYEAIVAAVPGMKFGLAFCESSGDCKVRLEGNDEKLKTLAAQNAMNVAAGHAFIILLEQGFPINVLNQIKNLAEVCTIYAATANPLEIIVADSGTGRGILGVIDGLKVKGIENEKDADWRKNLLRKLGYKR